MPVSDDVRDYGLPPRGVSFWTLFVHGSDKPMRVIFRSLDEALEIASDFTRRIKQPVHVLQVVATVEEPKAPVEVLRYNAGLATSVGEETTNATTGS